ncbi:MAG: Gfo/Idh/MocA family oxidoreductase, partial [Chloroflexota bacterium]|nr:Gfo/Idh/MocA family oxidoreductase [Chloroflexota bacterium]
MVETTARRIRIGILSLAHHHAESYLALLRQMPGVDLVGLWDEDEARGTTAADGAGIQWFGSEAALLGSGLDGALVTSVNSEHRRLTELASEAGAHVLCEKPLATSIRDGQAMVAACAAAGVRLMTCFPMRWSPVVRALSASIADGTVGELVCLEGINTGQVPDRHRAWFVDP